MRLSAIGLLVVGFFAGIFLVGMRRNAKAIPVRSKTVEDRARLGQ